jgi:hypothetical protein
MANNTTINSELFQNLLVQSLRFTRTALLVPFLQSLTIHKTLVKLFLFLSGQVLLPASQVKAQPLLLLTPTPQARPSLLLNM